MLDSSYTQSTTFLISIPKQIDSDDWVVNEQYRAAEKFLEISGIEQSRWFSSSSDGTTSFWITCDKDMLSFLILRSYVLKNNVN